MKTRQLWFIAPERIEIREQLLPTVAVPGHMLVENICSGISAGTEMLVYRGQIPEDLALDANLSSLQAKPTYPLQYGYACVGRVREIGEGVDSQWRNKLVFAFQPHASHFIATPDDVVVVPDNMEAEDAVFLANMETAVTLVHDGDPKLGEKVVVLGQGIVGLLLSGVLAHFPLEKLYAVDAISGRRDMARELGATQTFDSNYAADRAELIELLNKDEGAGGADLVYEVSGVPEALDLAVATSGFASRIIIGSWYGNKSAPVALGGHAHRNRLRISTSQVSTITPELSARWNKQRRFDVAWDMIRRAHPRRLITHRVSLDDAGEFYQLLASDPQDVLQAIIVY